MVLDTQDLIVELSEFEKVPRLSRSMRLLRLVRSRSCIELISLRSGESHSSHSPFRTSFHFIIYLRLLPLFSLSGGELLSPKISSVDVLERDDSNIALQPSSQHFAT